ncbi:MULTISPECIES: hypothetical protein [Nocardia]|uniref:hypothetical protein n=1 Tax=Nocardia TaxID=1817 RepID=UPI000ACCC4E7|nr:MULTISPECIES: hypothetical protein [Nocardia]MCC3316745.1 hypothetical protein [Nocardia africana]
MTATAKFSAFVVGLAAVFALAMGAGAVLGPAPAADHATPAVMSGHAGHGN